MKQKIYNLSPNILQNLSIYLFNRNAYKKRYGEVYGKLIQEFLLNRSLTYSQLKELQNKKFLDLVSHALANSPFYKGLYANIEMPSSIEEIDRLPIVDKEMLRKNISEVYTISEKEGNRSKTGGTTGKSLEVLYTNANTQERFALLDDFRGRFGYKLGRRTAWFSGKSLLTSRDIKKNRFWKTDPVHNVRYYSTFHIKEEYLKHYVEDIIRFKPEFLSGFPSTILEIASYGLKHGYEFPKGVCKAIFPTAETLTDAMREPIERFFKCKMYDQYASSEGAPFIFECKEGNLHMELQSGVFEVLDDDDRPSASGRLVVTSFTTYGTPLIRYDIGDSITREEEGKTCSCGNNNPMVKEILGRIDDYIYSPENGKINIINIANAIKDVKGVVRFQVTQNELNTLCFDIVTDPKMYNEKEEKRFIQNWRDRVGDKMEISINHVEDIPVERSGKFRIVKNNIKHLVE